MARPMKNGLMYFPMDVDFFKDRRVRSLKMKFGMDGVAIYLYILCMIYEEDGYYTSVDEDFYLYVEDDTGIEEKKAREVLEFLCDRNIFNKALAQDKDVLTSEEIQMRFQEAKKGSKRDFKVNPDYWLVSEEETLGFIKFADSFSEKNEGNSEKNKSFSEKNAQIKENKIKENKIIEKQIKENAGAAVAQENLEKVIEAYEADIAPITKSVKNSMKDWLDKVSLELILYAIKEAAGQNVRKWVYINAIINNHYKSGKTTPDLIRPTEDLHVYDEIDFDYDSLELIMQKKYDCDFTDEPPLVS